MQNHLLLASLRVNNNLTLQDMADILGISLTSYKLVENGIRTLTLENYNSLSNYFNVSLDYLFMLTNDKKTNNFRSSIDYKYLKFCVRFLRRRARITQKELAYEFNIHVATLSRYETEPEKATANYLYFLAKKFHISLDYMCGKSLKRTYTVIKNKTNIGT